MENSIEEDIAITKKLITTKFNNDYSIDNKDKEAIEHILTDYKRVLKEKEELLEVKVSTSAHNRILELEKENEELKERIREHTLLISPYYVKENFIPVQKIKDKIEKLNDESHAEKLEDIMIGNNYTITELVQYVLQELLNITE